MSNGKTARDDMDHAWRVRTAKALRLAADACERGEFFEWVSVGVDGAEWHTNPVDAESDAVNAIEAEDGEFHPDAEGVSWGIYVPVESAVMERLPDDHYAAFGMDSPACAGLDEWCDLSLQDAWDGEPDISDREAAVVAAAADYLAAVDAESGQAVALLRLREVVRG